MDAPLTDAGYRSLIVSELHGEEALLGVVDALWRAHWRYSRNAYARYLRTKRGAIKWLLGNLDERKAPVNVEDDNRVRASERKQILFKLLEETNGEIAALGRGGGGPVVQQTPGRGIVPAPTGAPDANDLRYGPGSPYDRGSRVIPP